MTETDFGAEKSHVIQRPCLALLGAIGGDAIGALALPEKFALGRIDPLPEQFEILGRDLS